MSYRADITIIGAGVVGLAIAAQVAGTAELFTPVFIILRAR